MSASSKRTRRVEIQGQEASWASEADREMSGAIGSAGATEMATREVGDEAERTAQRAAHATT